MAAKTSSVDPFLRKRQRVLTKGCFSLRGKDWNLCGAHLSDGRGVQRGGGAGSSGRTKQDGVVCHESNSGRRSHHALCTQDSVFGVGSDAKKLLKFACLDQSVTAKNTRGVGQGDLFLDLRIKIVIHVGNNTLVLRTGAHPAAALKNPFSVTLGRDDGDVAKTISLNLSHVVKHLRRAM